jgi:putative hydroxymethylpyrimidine transport system substrate-binding protein
MKRVVALLAAVTLALGTSGCGGGGAEPGAPERATLVLDFQPNAVHAGIYAALARGYYADRGVDLTAREPSSSTDAPKLLIAGRAQFAIVDIHDLGVALDHGIKLVGVTPIVNRPLASVIAASRRTVRRPRDLEGKTVGVTGLPSDDAVLDSVVSADGGDPAAVHRVTIGFQAVSALAAGKVAAATAFWNAEGVTLRRQGIPIRVFRVDRYGAPRYPELVLCTSAKTADEHPGLVRSVAAATRRGYALVARHPAAGVDALLESVPGLDEDDQRAQLAALVGAHAFTPPGRFNRSALNAWSRWDVRHDILERPVHVQSAFPERLP